MTNLTLNSPSGSSLSSAAPEKPVKGDPWSAGRYNWIGYLTLAFLVFGLGAWGSFAELNGAVVGAGMVEVVTKRQVVEHANGGVVGQINVKDGDVVKAGDVLLRFDDTIDRSELGVIESQLFSLLGSKARMIAEQNEEPTINFDPELLERAKTQPEAAEIVTGQTRLLAARRETRDKQIAQLEERKLQMRKQNEGLEARAAALQKQLVLIRDDLQGQNSLLQQGLTQKSRVLSLERDLADIDGNLSATQASIAENNGKLSEIDLAILNVSSQMREESITALREAEAKIAELRENRISRQAVLARMDVISPTNGVVFGLTVHALRSVVRAAEPIMYIIPQDVDLVITTQISPSQIDQVHLGQDAKIRFAAFDHRTTPELTGQINLISADVAKDERTGATYYTAQVKLDQAELSKLGTLKVLPGMPVEVYMQTGQRTPIQYLVKPLAHYFDKAFRER